MDVSLLNLLFQSSLGSGGTLLQVAYLLCLFGVAVFRPERIASTAKFRFGCLLFGLSILVPPLLMQVAAVGASGRTFGGGTPAFTSVLGPGGATNNYFRAGIAAGPVLFGLSIILVLSAILSPASPGCRRQFDQRRHTRSTNTERVQQRLHRSGKLHCPARPTQPEGCGLRMGS